MNLFGQNSDDPPRALENEIMAANARIEDLTAQFAAAEKTRRAETKRVEELAAELVTVEKKRQQIQNEKTTATARVEELTAELVAIEKKRQDIQGEKTTATARVEELTAELVAVEKKRQDIQGEKTTATARVEELTAELVAVEEKRQDNQKAVAELQRGRREAEQRFAVLQEGKAPAPSTSQITLSTQETSKPGVSNGLTLLLGFIIGAAAMLWLPWQLTAIATVILCFLVLTVFYRSRTKLAGDEGVNFGISGSDDAI